jgi:hypothetical protein
VASFHFVAMELQNRLHGHLRLQVELAKLSQRYCSTATPRLMG